MREKTQDFTIVTKDVFVSKKAINFRKTDVKRTVEALQRAGIRIGRVELQAGKVVFFPATKGEDEIPLEPTQEIIL